MGTKLGWWITSLDDKTIKEWSAAQSILIGSERVRIRDVLAWRRKGDPKETKRELWCGKEHIPGPTAHIRISSVSNRCSIPKLIPIPYAMSIVSQV